jgi:CRISPR-associated protein Cmr3
MANEVTTWSFEPIDTWFFRDGTTFVQGENPAVHPVSMFPPFIYPLQAAIRTCLAKAMGWSVGESLPEGLGDVDHLGQLELRGPYVCYKKEILYPLPAILCGEQGKRVGMLIPSDQAVLCDLGNVRLLQMPAGLRRKGLDGYVTSAGLTRLLQGEMPLDNEWLTISDLFAYEPRIGITIDSSTRTAEEGLLYSATHVRLRESVELVVEVRNIPAHCQVAAQQVLPLGGENRYARVQVKRDRIPLPSLPAVDHTYRVFVTLLTPGKFRNLKNVIRYGPFGQAISASIGKLQRIGGWDVVKKQPRTMEPFIPAGSTWFYELTADEWEQFKHYHGKCVGEKTAYGFGQIVFGVWKKGETT